MNNYDALMNAPQQKRSQALTLQILNAAERVMRRQGPEITIREVAAEAGVSLGGIYARFADREELLSAVHSQLLNRFEARVIKGINSLKIVSIRKVLEVFVKEVATTCRKDGQALAVLRTGANAEAGLQRIAGTEDLFCKVLHEAMLKSGEPINRADPEGAIRIVVQIVLATLTRSVAHSSKASAEYWSPFCTEIVDVVDGYLSSSPPVARSSPRRPRTAK